MRKEILDTNRAHRPRIVETIRHLMFVFEDLLLLDPERRQGSAVEGRPEDSHYRPQRHQRPLEEAPRASHVATRREMLREDMEALGPIKIRDVEAAPAADHQDVRQLEAEGVDRLNGGPESSMSCRMHFRGRHESRTAPRWPALDRACTPGGVRTNLRATGAELGDHARSGAILEAQIKRLEQAMSEQQASEGYQAGVRDGRHQGGATPRRGNKAVLDEMAVVVAGMASSGSGCESRPKRMSYGSRCDRQASPAPRTGRGSRAVLGVVKAAFEKIDARRC